MFYKELFTNVNDEVKSKEMMERAIMCFQIQHEKATMSGILDGLCLSYSFMKITT